MTRPLFISYSHQDQEWMRRLATHLQAVPRTAALDLWVDTLIGVGEEWYAQIVSALRRSQAAVLLLSADFLTSGFVQREELPALLSAEAKQGLALIPVLAKPCTFELHEWVASRQVRPRGAVALSSMAEHEADSALADIAREVVSLGARREAAPLTDVGAERFAAPPQLPRLEHQADWRGPHYLLYVATERVRHLFAQLPLETLRNAALAVPSGPAADAHLADPPLASAAFSDASAKLPIVLREIEHRCRVGDLARVIAEELRFDFDWYLIEGLVTVSEWQPRAAHIALDQALGDYRLTILCTKSNVLGMTKEQGEWIPTSAGLGLSVGGLEIPVAGLVRIIAADRGQRHLMATPLYLMLTPVE